MQWSEAFGLRGAVDRPYSSSRDVKMCLLNTEGKVHETTVCEVVLNLFVSVNISIYHINFSLRKRLVNAVLGVQRPRYLHGRPANFFFYLGQQPPVGQGFLIHKIS
jgi:hypothetical protein